MSDVYVEENPEAGLFTRLGGAIKGVVVGMIFVLGAFILLFWNEGRAVHRANVLNEVADKTVSIDPASISPANEGKPVHFTGSATGEDLADKRFGVARNAVHLERYVEMYQWHEDERTEGTGKDRRTTYRYDTKWSESLINSDRFRTTRGHENPKSKRVPTEKLTAKRVDVGAFTLPGDLVDEIDNWKPVPATEQTLAAMEPALRDGAALAEEKVFLPGDNAKADFNGGRTVDPRNPRVGDLRIRFRVVEPGPVSVIAMQAGKSLAPFHAKDGDMSELHVGTHSAEAMFKAEHSKNGVIAWVLRGVGFLVMWIGFAIVLYPLRVMASVVGVIGDLVGMGIALVSGLTALILSVSTIAVAWVFYRPVLGIGLLVMVAAMVWYFARKRRQAHDYRLSHAPPSTYPPYAPAAAMPNVMPPLPPQMGVAGVSHDLPPVPAMAPAPRHVAASAPFPPVPQTAQAQGPQPIGLPPLPGV